jgi:hypothetical protein
MAKTRSLVLNETVRRQREAIANRRASSLIARTVPVPLTGMLLAERAATIQRLIETLRPRQRAVIRGRMADLDDGRIAEVVLGQDSNSARALVRKLFQRACDDLRSRLQRA